MKRILFLGLLIYLSACQMRPVDISKLQGHWQVIDMDRHELIIEKDSIRYPETHQVMHYEIKDDTLLYVFFERPGDSIVRVTEFGIRKLNRKELHIDNGTDKIAIYRRK
jgi:hypothetical protein